MVVIRPVTAFIPVNTFVIYRDMYFLLNHRFVFDNYFDNDFKNWVSFYVLYFIHLHILCIFIH